MRGFIVLLLILGAPAAMASPFMHHDPGRDARHGFMHPVHKNLLGREYPTPRFGNQQAAAQVRHAYANYRILSLRLMDNGKGPPIYRAKTLTPNGVVKYIYVDAISGDVFH